MTRSLDFHGNTFVRARRQTVTGAAGAATKNGRRVQLTTEALTTADGAKYTLTLTNAEIKADSLVLVAVKLGTATQGTPIITTITPAAAGGSVVVIVKNIDGTNAVNGTLIFDFLVFQNTQSAQ